MYVYIYEYVYIYIYHIICICGIHSDYLCGVKHRAKSHRRNEHWSSPHLLSRTCLKLWRDGHRNSGFTHYIIAWWFSIVFCKRLPEGKTLFHIEKMVFQYLWIQIPLTCGILLDCFEFNHHVFVIPLSSRPRNTIIEWSIIDSTRVSTGGTFNHLLVDISTCSTVCLVFSTNIEVHLKNLENSKKNASSPPKKCYIYP